MYNWAQAVTYDAQSELSDVRSRRSMVRVRGTPLKGVILNCKTAASGIQD